MKQLLFAMLGCILLSSTVFAANDTVDIRDVKLRYCNGTGEVTKSLELSTKPGVTEQLCLEFANEGSATAHIGLNFVDGTLTADNDQKKACLPEGQKELFGQYVTGYQDTFTLPGHMKTRIFSKIAYPDGYVGMSYGCVTYFLVDAQPQHLQQGENMFDIFARVGSFVDIFVDGKINAKLITLPVEGYAYEDIAHNQNVAIYRYGKGRIAAKTTIYNTGNVAVTGTIDLSWSTWFGLFHGSSHYDNYKILPKQSASVDVTVPWLLAILLGGPLSVQVHADYTPMLFGHTSQQVDTYTLVDSNSVFLFPWILIVILALISFVMYMKHYRIRSNGSKHKKVVLVDSTATSSLPIASRSSTSRPAKKISKKTTPIGKKKSA